MGMTCPHRSPAVAGSFYPARVSDLEKMLEKCLSLPQKTSKETRKVKALVVPHAGYIYSGPIAAYGFKEVPDWTDVTRIHLWGPAHRVGFRGLAVAPQKVWDTPLGSLECDWSALDNLLSQGAVTLREDAHRDEHCLEVQLPFLQYLGFRGKILPLLFGDMDPLGTSVCLEGILAPGDLILVSTDLSHFYPYATAREKDLRLLSALEKGDLATAASGEACGSHPLLTLMYLAERRNWRARLLDYRNSGDTAGDRNRVVGYAAISYQEALE